MAPRLALLALPVVLALGTGTASSAPAPAPLGLDAPHAVPTADDLPAGSAIANDQIYQVVRSGDTVYAYGYFDTVGRYAGPGAVLSAADATQQPSPQIADGQVSVAVSDDAGGWYLGGDFARIGGHDSGGLAHVLADGTLDTGFLPVADGLVSAMALVDDTLYVGGSFATVDGTSRQRLAALSTEDGSVLAFDQPQGARVTELLAGPDRVYVASDGLYALDPTTGAKVPGFSSSATTPIHALELGDDRLYVGAAGVTALDPETGAVDAGFEAGTPLAVDALRRVHSLLYTADRLYVGSDRTLIQGQPGRLAAVDPETGAIDAGFNPSIPAKGMVDRVPAGVYDLALDAGHLWAGGSFKGGLAVVEATTGADVELDLPAYDLQVNAVDQSDGALYVGGHFYMSDRVQTRGVAAFDAETLDPLPGFQADIVNWGDLFVGAGAVWVAPTHFWGYDPSQSAAESHQFFYNWTDDVDAIDPETGARIPERSVQVKNLTGITTIGNRLYVARRLENDQRFPRNRVDVYGPGGTKVDSFPIKPRGYITQLTSIGGDLVVAGSFVGSKSYWTSGLAMLRINPANGKPRAYFDPHTHGPVYDVARSRGGLVASGLFRKFEGVYDAGPRPGLTRMDEDSRMDTEFLPQPFAGNRVLVDVHPLGDLLWVNGSSRAFLDAETGQEVPSPLGARTPWWVTGTAGDLTYTSMLYPSLGGQDSIKLGYVAAAR